MMQPVAVASQCNLREDLLIVAGGTKNLGEINHVWRPPRQ